MKHIRKRVYSYLKLQLLTMQSLQMLQHLLVQAPPTFPIIPEDKVNSHVAQRIHFLFKSGQENHTRFCLE